MSMTISNTASAPTYPMAKPYPETRPYEEREVRPGKERIIENQSSLESDVRHDEEQNAGGHHPVLHEEHESCAENAREGEEKKEPLSVTGEVCRGAQRGREDCGADHGQD